MFQTDEKSLIQKKSENEAYAFFEVRIVCSNFHY
jgi:hypothetical protein